ncbi:MAG TPA: mobile mystery protein A [Rhizomicrobium sp.]|jgi:predicted DNA-binding mobile mystery protein A|nr:mobile mystery protein A [Rhizomicrobium sp.]
MNDAIHHLDQRFREFLALKDTTRPSRGWIRAIRDALGMTTAQLASRMGVSQPRVVAIEKAEANRAINLKTLERAAEALGCRVVYVFVPKQSLEDSVRARAQIIADKQLSALNQTMRLEDQSVRGKRARRTMREKLIADLVNDPSRLWDEAW